MRNIVSKDFSSISILKRTYSNYPSTLRQIYDNKHKTIKEKYNDMIELGNSWNKWANITYIAKTTNLPKFKRNYRFQNIHNFKNILGEQRGKHFNPVQIAE